MNDCCYGIRGKKIKSLKVEKEPELTQFNHLKFETDIDKLIDRMSKILDCNILEVKVKCHSSPESKESRDIAVFFLMKNTALSNRSNDDKLNLTGSAIGKIISSFQIEIKKIKTWKSELKISILIFKFEPRILVY